jgi:hypothetical protein
VQGTRYRWSASIVALIVLVPGAGKPVAASAQAPAPRDYLTFARGAVPVHIDGVSAVGMEQALRVADGDPATFALLSRVPADAAVTITYALPAPTIFERFTLPNVRENPGAGQTFVRDVEIAGSADGADDGFSVLASTTLTAHEKRGEITALGVADPRPVRWIRVRLSGALDARGARTIIEFSEIAGYGRQDPVAGDKRFNGTWRLARGVVTRLRQEGQLVTGCYDTYNTLTGTVGGNVLRALGADAKTGEISAFVLNVTGTGELVGLRSNNGGPFRVYEGNVSPGGLTVRCPLPLPEPTVGCGATLHGVEAGADASSLVEGAPLLDALGQNLRAHPRAVTIVAHASGEVADSDAVREETRSVAEAVVAALVGRGLDRDRLTAVGAGAGAPLASPRTESGRSLNERIEVGCR